MRDDEERQHAAGSVDPPPKRRLGRRWISGLAGFLVGASIGGIVVETSRAASLQAATAEIRRQVREIQLSRGKNLDLILETFELSSDNYELRQALKAWRRRFDTRSAQLAMQSTQLAKLRIQLGFDAQYEVPPGSFPISVRYEVGSGSFRITPEELWQELGYYEIRGRISYLGGLGCEIASATIEAAYFEGGRVVGTKLETFRRLRTDRNADLLIGSRDLAGLPGRASITLTEAACVSGQ